MEYQKINTLFKRDSNNIIIPSQYTLPEFEYLKNNKFECTEKIDGTNIRVEIDWLSEKEYHIQFKGRTDKSSIPEHLRKRLEKIFCLFSPNDVFKWKEPCHITIYGEGYGAKIQSGGNYIPNGVDFILFDIRVGKWWFSRKALEEIAGKLNIKIVPLVGYMTIPEAVEYVKAGLKSSISYNKNYEAEGLVLKTPDGILFRNGERIILKIKTVDFRKYESMIRNKPSEK